LDYLIFDFVELAPFNETGDFDIRISIWWITTALALCSGGPQATSCAGGDELAVCL
jgi:hypothetical protein